MRIKISSYFHELIPIFFLQDKVASGNVVMLPSEHHDIMFLFPNVESFFVTIFNGLAWDIVKCKDLCLKKIQSIGFCNLPVLSFSSISLLV